MEARTIVVTGASSGIGRAVAERALNEGHRVIGIARRAGQAGLDHGRFTPVNLDLADLDSLPAQLEALAKAHRAVDGVVCCAGMGRFGSLEEFSYSQIRELVELNLVSQIYLVRALLPGLKRHDHGDVILMGSEAALSGGKRGAVYSATKFALRGFAQALREECGRSGVRVSIINPGMVKTEFFSELNFAPGDDPTHYILPEDVAEAVNMVLSGRPGTVFDEVNLSPLKKVVQFKKDNPPE